MQVECNGLQKECSVLRSEKQDVVSKHQKERSGLQNECASLRAEKEELLKTHQKEKGILQSESAALRSEKEALLQKQQQLEKDLARSASNIHPHLCALSDSFTWICSNIFCYTVYCTYFCDSAPVELGVVLFLVVRMPKMPSWPKVSKALRDPSRSWRRGWRLYSSSTSRIAPCCKPNWMRQTTAARLCRERYAVKTKQRHPPESA